MLNKTTLLILFALVGVNANAQTHRFFYNLEYKLDSTSEHTSKRTMVLDVNPKNVKYYDYQGLVKDSLNKKLNDRSISWTDQQPVVRKRGDYNHINYQMISFQLYSFPTHDPINWNLVHETKTYEGYTLQKATSNFGGRHWTAWFTKDIPLSEGPYKFQGLPGLIVLLYDSQMQYNFTLAKSKNLPQTYDTSNIIEVRYGNKPIPVSEKVFVQKSIDYFKDPFYEDRQELAAGKMSSIEIDGKKITNPNELLAYAKEEQEDLLKENNPIERNKAIKYPAK